MEQTWAQLIQSVGFPMAALLIVVAAFIRGWVVPGHVYRESLRREERATNVALRTTETARGGLGLAERAVGRVAGE